MIIRLLGVLRREPSLFWTSFGLLVACACGRADELVFLAGPLPSAAIGVCLTFRHVPFVFPSTIHSCSVFCAIACQREFRAVREGDTLLLLN